MAVMRRRKASRIYNGIMSRIESMGVYGICEEANWNRGKLEMKRSYFLVAIYTAIYPPFMLYVDREDERV